MIIGFLKYTLARVTALAILAVATSCSPGYGIEDHAVSGTIETKPSINTTKQSCDQAEASNTDTQASIQPGKASISDLKGDPSMYAAYYKILQEKINKYGSLPIKEHDDTSDILLLNYDGVAYAVLLDFDGNGEEELFICYNDQESKSSNIPGFESPCIFEILGYKNNRSYLIAKEAITVFGGGSTLWGHINIYKQGEKYYVVNTIVYKEVNDSGTIYYKDITYWLLTDGKWVKKELACTDGDSVPWDDAECIYIFDEFWYDVEDAERLQLFLSMLEEYSNMD